MRAHDFSADHETGDTLTESQFALLSSNIKGVFKPKRFFILCCLYAVVITSEPECVFNRLCYDRNTGERQIVRGSGGIPSQMSSNVERSFIDLFLHSDLFF